MVVSFPFSLHYPLYFALYSTCFPCFLISLSIHLEYSVNFHRIVISAVVKISFIWVLSACVSPACHHNFSPVLFRKCSHLCNPAHLLLEITSLKVLQFCSFLLVGFSLWFKVLNCSMPLPSINSLYGRASLDITSVFVLID